MSTLASGKTRRTLPALNSLAAFDVTARLGSFRAAADEMHLTQGAVAQQVRALEAELGCPLFDRHARGLRLTAAGAAYAERVRLALGIVEDATRELLDHHTRRNDFRLTLGTTVALASRWLLPRLPKLAEAHPQISLMIEASDISRPLRGKDGIDIAIRWGQPPFQGVSAEFLLSGEAVAVCSPNLTHGKTLTPKALAKMPLISDSHNNWKRWFEVYGRVEDFRKGPTFSQTSLALDAAERGIGIALAPRVLVQDALASGTLMEVLSAQYRLDTGSGFYVLTAESAAPESPLGDLVKWLQHESGK
ncbi:LysR family transcriptional regulator, glycine cleavage system transcriptional activator [Polaromonas sp. YR568]|uniref:LysR substrate-binding domain-containing protein n=1 Tax=Polaromonas sp. YR568 TaxID=1855301 RepID=UPI0008F0B9F5|nr:LysR substrate-binding domain-containing protein [Polaromonas sp. YR568]SFV00411.1 LysR family transcriptional regulator, glycine cleavage system transcriptional activator [Polaromonas sp. YR568]